jgi:lysophospholipid acyltransferase (LPLAT)-like uncharacterized protein
VTDPQPAPNSPAARKPQVSGVVVPNKLAWHGKLAALVLFIAIKLFSATWRVRPITNLPNLKGPVIYCIWHNRLAVCMKVHEMFGKRLFPARGLAALISASKDGALLARVLKYFDVSAVRGSSSRRGRQALLEMTGKIQEGYNAAITPDGPKGPKYKIQEGVIALSQLTGAPIVPVSIRINRKWTTRSWDAFQIPKLFARCEISVGEPLQPPRETSDEERERFRAELERRMMEITFD